MARWLISAVPVLLLALPAAGETPEPQKYKIELSADDVALLSQTILAMKCDTLPALAACQHGIVLLRSLNDQTQPKPAGGPK